MPKIRWRFHIPRRKAVRLFAACLVTACLAFAILMAWPMDTGHYLDSTPSQSILDRNERTLYSFLNDEEQWCFPKSLDAVSPHLIKATLATEDQHFYFHPGVDPLAVCRAIGQNLGSKQIVSGASTLTMQIVKLSDASKRSLFSKLEQATQALRLEVRTDKGDILEAYLNNAPYGMNLVGCESAALRYFGKPAAELTLSEAALLAGLPKAPTAYAPLKHPQRAIKRRNHVLLRMFEEGHISEKRYAEAIRSSLGARWHEFPKAAPHLAMQINKKTETVRTTIDLEIQESAQRLTKQHLGKFLGEVGNAAMIVVDVPSATVLAHVGSADFFGTPGGGQVDVCSSLRSPGSALKPFAYAWAMEQQQLYSSEMLLDDRLDYGLYDPENYDGRYHGLVRASEALKRSLNVPAITVLERIGTDTFYSFLEDAGIGTLTQSPGHYGLGLVLGSCEVRLDELAAAYCMLANLGEYRELRTVSEPADTRASKRLITRGTCIKLFEMLEQHLPNEAHRAGTPVLANTTRVCWKTGTSSKHRDAWAFVFNRQYVVGVWMGNNDGAPSPYLVGSSASLPLAAEMFRKLPAADVSAWPDVYEEIHSVQICAESGLPASRFCKDLDTEKIPRNQFLHRVCDVHYPVVVGDKTEVFERWPGAARRWDLAKISAPVVRDAERRNGLRKESLEILRPPDKAEYVVTGESNGDRIKLKTSLDEESEIHWYLDDVYIGKSQPDSRLSLPLKPGKHTLACLTLGHDSRSSQDVDVVDFEVVLPGKGVVVQ